MPIELGQTPQPNFDQPLDLIKDCHRRIEYFFDVLLRITALRGKALDDEHHEALEKSLNYFKYAAKRHTEDEEVSVFDRLRKSEHPVAIEAIKMIDTLEVQHQQADVMHKQIEALGRLWLKQNHLDEIQATELDQLVKHLQFFYQQHIAMEDNHVFPAAEVVLTPEQLAQVGKEMQERRRLNYGRPGSRCAKRRAARADQARQANNKEQTPH